MGSSLRDTADGLLRRTGTSLEDFLVEQRDEGKSFEQIARDLHARTSGLVEVSYATVRRWFLDLADRNGEAA